jgi:hypothetical protein
MISRMDGRLYGQLKTAFAYREANTLSSDQCSCSLKQKLAALASSDKNTMTDPSSPLPANRPDPAADRKRMQTWTESLQQTPCVNCSLLKALQSRPSGEPSGSSGQRSFPTQQRQQLCQFRSRRQSGKRQAQRCKQCLSLPAGSITHRSRPELPRVTRPRLFWQKFERFADKRAIIVREFDLRSGAVVDDLPPAHCVVQPDQDCPALLARMARPKVPKLSSPPNDPAHP